MSTKVFANASNFVTALKGTVLAAEKPRSATPIIESVRWQVADGRLTLTATDRYALVEASMGVIQEGPDWCGPISATDAKSLSQILAKQRGRTLVELGNLYDRPHSVGLEDGRVFPVVEGNYPRVESILAKFDDVPDSPTVSGVSISPAILATLSKLPRRKGTPVTLRFAGDNKVVYSGHAFDDVTFRVALMPMRVEEK